MNKITVIFSALVWLCGVSAASAGESPQEARHEVMESVGDAAKPVGQMLKGEREFDAQVAMASFRTWAEAADGFGQLFPEGSESGHDTEARETIWTDREGFNAALAAWADAVDTAIAASPRTLEELKPAAGMVFKQCKACHEDYRVKDES
jgi:cytochrome c556